MKARMSLEGVMFEKSAKKALVLGSLIAAATFGTAQAEPLPLFAFLNDEPAQTQQVAPQHYAPADQADVGEDAQLDPRLQRQIVNYSTREAPGTIVIDTPNTYLYLVLGNGQAMRYGIGVGREGFTWAGVQKVARKAEWPDWYPPQSMIARQPYLPRVTMGGPGNPLGARAMYLGSTEYRIHGTNDPTTIGKQVSSGCVRLTNDDVTDLYNRVQVGAKVVVMPMNGNTIARAPAARPANTAQITAQPVSLSSSYVSARQSSAQQTWASIR
jgi:lipoprotein-anchoring transpeptidase ErfK/SrfK